MASANPNDEDYDPSLVNTGVYTAPPPPADTSQYPAPQGFMRDASGKLVPIPGYFDPSVDTSDPTHMNSNGIGFNRTTMQWEDQRKNNPAATTPVDTGGGGGGAGGATGPILPGGTIGSLLESYGGAAQPAYVDPRGTLPTQPAYTPPPAFEAPTGDQVRGTPGYQFGLDEGRRNVEASAAARGTLNTGGTLEDVLKYGQGYADQQYQTSLNNAMNIYGVNYGTQYLDPYNFKMKGYQNAVDANINGATGQNAYNQNSWLNQYNAWRNHNLDNYNMLYGLTSLGAGAQ